jgi:prepilin-type N-terminal cleavage/methylation domain-containing protein
MHVSGSKAGLTLVELLIATAVMAMLAVATTGLVSACLNAQKQGHSQGRLYEEAIAIMDRVTGSIRTATYVVAPNAHARTRALLMVSGTVNDDGDFYFGDPLFPRIDEDPKDDMNLDNESGVLGFDDDGDGRIDEEGDHDDDEDGVDHEDILDGKDNDGDGNIDEDLDNDATKDGKSGIAGMDDDGDGLIDEAETDDDDEDGTKDEDPLNETVYWIPAGTVLRADVPSAGTQDVLSEHAKHFQITSQSPDRFLVELTLDDGDGNTIALRETACARNVFQKGGKRVR